jgi:hypothetical protein
MGLAPNRPAGVSRDMDTPDLIALGALVVAVAGTAGGGLGWLLKGRQDRRKVLPIINWDGQSLHVLDRLNEDLTITEVRAAAPVHFGEYATDNGGSIIPGTQKVYPSPVAVSWFIPAGERRSFPLTVFTDRAAHLELTISSSWRTLTDVRIKVARIARR